jgi:membrane protein
MPPGVRDVLHMAKQAAGDWSSDHASSMGAAIAYYTLFSLAPLLVIAVAIAGAVFGADAARGEIMGQLQGLMGPDAARAIELILASAGNRSAGTVASIAGIVTLFLGASTVFAELQTDLDRIWKVRSSEHGGVRDFLVPRLLSFGMVLAIGFLLIVSLVLSATVAALGKLWADRLAGGVELLMHGADLLVSICAMTLLFAMIYKILPRTRIAWRDVWIGAAITSLLFSVGKVLVGLYIGKTGAASGYGAAGAVVLVLLWVYYSAQIFLLGAEFTKVYAHRHGSRTARA